MIPHKETHKPQKGSTRTCIVMFLLVTLLLCIGILTMYITVNQRLVDVENQLKAHDKQLKVCWLLQKQFGQDDTSSGGMSFKGSNVKQTEEKHNLKKPNRVSRSTDNISPNILNSIRSEVRQHLLNVTAEQFCVPPNKICLPGPSGQKGQKGRRGARGRRGRPGKKGIKGPIGPTGKYGKQGFRGPPGLKGEKGDPGNLGPRGLPGPKGERGEQVSEPSVLVSPSTLTVTQNQTASFHCNAHGNPKPKVTWKRQSGNLIDLGKTRIENSGLLEISNVDANDTGNYTCTAKSILGEDTTTVQLLVKFPPRFTFTPTPYRTVLQGNNVSLTCAASGYPQPDVTWSKVPGSLPFDRAQQKEGKLTISGLQLSDSGLYRCNAVNSLGERTTHTTLNFLDLKLCKNALGMESRAIPDSSITASSFYAGSSYYPHFARLNSAARGWASKDNTLGQWIQMDLNKERIITAVATQGCKIDKEWVTSYSLQYSSDGKRFKDYQAGKVFAANTDSQTAVRNDLIPAMSARYIRIIPKTYSSHKVLRIEIYGC